MFTNIFPRALLGLVRQTFPRHRLQPAMLPLTTTKEYQARALAVPAERHVLNPEELRQAAAFSNSKRRDEWLTGRICAKLALMQYHSSRSDTSPLPLKPQEIIIANRPDGRPSLSISPPMATPQPDLSISHGAEFGLALVADCWCGIDVQQQRESLYTVREKFCLQEEEELLQHSLGDLPELLVLTQLWTAKEAAKKALSNERMPGFLELILTKAEAHATGWVLEFLISSRAFTKYPATITVAAELYEGYGLAISLTGKEQNA